MSENTRQNGQAPAVPLYGTAEELCDLAAFGLLVTGPDGHVLQANRTLSQWLGYNPQELLAGKRFTDLLTVGGKIFFETHFRLLLRVQSSVEEIALDFVRKDGSVLPALINGRQQPAADGQPGLHFFAIFNATERRKYERELLATRDLLRITLSSIGDAVVSTDADGRVTFMNPEAEKLSGWYEDDARGKAIDEVTVMVREDTTIRIENPVLHALRTGEVVGLANHTSLLSKDGRCIAIDDSAAPIRDDRGVVVGGVLIFRDISKQRATQKKLTEAQALAQAMIDELKRSNEDLSQFAAVASHDLRSPLNNVMQFAQLIDLRYGDRLGDGRDLMNHLIAAARRMSALIEDLLRYAKFTSDISVATELTDANRQVDTAIEVLEASICGSHATVTHDALPMVTLDPTHLVQIFQNLIGNAIHYRGPEAPRIHIGVADEEGMYRFSCADNGVGIDAGYQAQIFEPFKRLHGPDRPGSGIGLAICKRIVERAGGRIWVESRVNEGSTFFFTLPKVSSAG
ncbi:MAG: domain S-box [Bryobacterales bacterium]|nr:domain S-box [Bryobacterales bacterium]